MGGALPIHRSDLCGKVVSKAGKSTGEGCVLLTCGVPLLCYYLYAAQPSDEIGGSPGGSLIDQAFRTFEIDAAQTRITETFNQEEKGPNGLSDRCSRQSGYRDRRRSGQGGIRGTP